MNLRPAVRLQLERLAAREGRSLSDLINELVEDALRARAGSAFSSHGAGTAEEDDLGVHAEKYLREGLG